MKTCKIVSIYLLLACLIGLPLVALLCSYYILIWLNRW